MVQATARHLLVSSEDKCEALKQEILGGADLLMWQRLTRLVHRALKVVILALLVLA